MTLGELQTEHREYGIGPLLAQLLERVVRSTAPTYPAAEYADGSEWTIEVLEDVLQDWIEDRLVRRGDLAAMMAGAASLASLRKALTTSFTQLLINRRRRSSASNLFKRTQRILESSSEIAPVGKAARAAQQQWALVEDLHETPSTHSLSDLIRLAYSMTDEELEVIRYGPQSAKSSPILREPQLKRFLIEIFAHAGGSLSLEQITLVLRHRFNLFAPVQVDLDEQLAAPDQSVSAEASLDDLAGSVLARLGAGPVDLLRRLQQTDSIRAAATAAGMRPSQAAAMMNGVMSMVSEYAESQEEAVAVYRRVLQKL